jgi:hypothetical protein
MDAGLLAFVQKTLTAVRTAVFSSDPVVLSGLDWLTLVTLTRRDKHR